MADWKKTEQLYEGKAKKVFATENPEVVIVDYKDDATAFNGEKKGTIVGKGVINNRMTNYIFQVLEKEGVPTHYVEELSDRETAVKKVEIVPLEVIVRNVAAGSFSKKLGIEEGTKLLAPTLEFSYKNDDLGDPMINDYFAIAIGAATREEIDKITPLQSVWRLEKNSASLPAKIRLAKSTLLCACLVLTRYLTPVSVPISP